MKPDSMRKRKRYYIPGMISLILLPIICFYYLKPHIKTETCLVVAYPSKYNPNIKNDLRYDTTQLSRPENRREYIDFVLNGNESINNKILDSFEIRNQTLVKMKDTIHGLHLLFGKTVNWGNVVKAINICFKDSFPRFMIYEDNLWTLYQNITPEIRESILKGRQEQKEENTKIIQDKVAEVYNMSFIDKYKGIIIIWPTIILFFILCIFSFQFIRNIS